MAKQKWRLKRRNFLTPARKKWAAKYAAALVRRRKNEPWRNLDDLLLLVEPSRCSEFFLNLGVARMNQRAEKYRLQCALYRRTLRCEALENDIAWETVVILSPSEIRRLFAYPEGPLPERIPVPLDIDHPEIRRAMAQGLRPAHYYLYPGYV